MINRLCLDTCEIKQLALIAPVSCNLNFWPAVNYAITHHKYPLFKRWKQEGKPFCKHLCSGSEHHMLPFLQVSAGTEVKPVKTRRLRLEKAGNLLYIGFYYDV
jgi:hypothetical protein